MAFPSNLATVALGKCVDDMMSQAGMVKTYAQRLDAKSSTGTCTIDDILNAARGIYNAKQALAALASTPGLPAYAKTELNSASYDIAAEYAAMLAQINATLAWIAANLPKDGSGYVLDYQVDATFAKVPRTFTSGSLAALRTQLAALVATVA